MIKKLKSSLANRIAFMLSLIFAVVFLVGGFFVFNFTYHQVLSHTTAETYIRAESLSKDVRNLFENARIVCDQMSYHPEIRAYLKQAVDKRSITENPYYRETLTTLEEIKQSNPLHFLAWVANEKANFYLDSDGTIPDKSYDVKKRPWYKVAIEAKGIGVTEPYIEWSTKRVVISTIKALREGNQVYGFVVLDIVLENVPALFENSHMYSGDKSFLIAADGTYVYHDDPNKIMNTGISDKKDALHAYETWIRSDNKSLKEILYEGKAYYLMSYKVDENGWRVISLIDKNNVNQRILFLGWVITLSLLLALVLSTVMVYLAVKRTTKPYNVAVTFANDIAAGDFSKNIPSDYMNRQDEMGQISRSFQSIIQAFRNENTQLEDRIQKKNEELASQYHFIYETEKAASLGNLVAGVAHEINTPLGVSMTTASYMAKVNVEARQKLVEGTMNKADLKHLMEVFEESIGLLNNNLNRAAELVKSFKQVAVDQSSEIETYFDLHTNIEDVVVSLRHEYKNKNIIIENNCPIGLRINSFPGAFSQIITNLLMNSIQHGFSGRNSGRVIFECVLVQDKLVMRYSDNGHGISKENLKRIYDPFFTTNRQKGNSGLGMNIIMNIVTQKLKGSIRCESELNMGTAFVIEIPLTAPKHESPAKLSVKS